MKALLVGADRLGNIPSTLNQFGINEYIHWSGRKKMNLIKKQQKKLN